MDGKRLHIHAVFNKGHKSPLLKKPPKGLLGTLSVRVKQKILGRGGKHPPPLEKKFPRRLLANQAARQGISKMKHRALFPMTPPPKKSKRLPPKSRAVRFPKSPFPWGPDLV